MKYTFTIACLLLLSTTAHAQCPAGMKCADLPEKPIPRVNVKLIDDTTGARIRLNLPVPHRTADRAYTTWAIVSQFATIADNENSLYSIKDNRARELNPLLGTHPSRGRYYAVGEVFYALTSYASYRSKREADAARAFGARPDFTHRYWWMSMAGNTAVHVVGIALTIRNTGR